MDYGILARSNRMKLKHLNDGFVSYKHAAFGFSRCLTDGLEWCGLLVDYCDVFISCLDSHSDGTHSLQRIHCYISPNLMKNNLIYILDGLRVSTFSAIFHFWVNYSFKKPWH